MGHTLAMEAATLLIVEDEPSIREALCVSLGNEGYHCISASDGPTGLKLALEKKPDLLVLDLMLPGMDGLSICRRVRQESNIPILMLTARDGENDQVLGFELGADDYVTKPFSLAVLKSRVRSLLRRANPDSKEAPSVLTIGDLTIDEARHTVTLKGAPLELTSTEFSLLLYLARSPGRAYSREQLLEEVWGYCFEGYRRTVDSHITRLRRKIEEDPSDPQFVLTVYKVGYKFRDDP